ncbi:putative small auxin-up RNA [Helianthus annuus]|uniref:Putative SAUR-like auxin-responsive protein family n=1 Tax=Helianthus annuus TaxID=4232 RepID=A0A251TF39_HELAN|nr:auxin-responsive protein SAUR50 [Helianthus annuus]KAF5784070.1 putative small auxin-up RNA [Helianthus annuus]KAJ0519261.1 putative small auxin-up RNA [Helianthus annuus]KAJ0872730.1 putative small auxin-up RNA [Helianthus annuus]KAJ0877128.1 putative small auxin-up RNA [Helianthus annuus]
MKIFMGKNGGKGGYKHTFVTKILMKTMKHCMLDRFRYIEFDFEHMWEKKVVPKDVKEGQFAVVAVKCEEPKRFVVELRCLTNPGFLTLLKKAGEEYGFKHDGAIAIPCEPHELQKILLEMEEK